MILFTFGTINCKGVINYQVLYVEQQSYGKKNELHALKIRRYYIVVILYIIYDCHIQQLLLFSVFFKDKERILFEIIPK